MQRWDRRALIARRYAPPLRRCHPERSEGSHGAAGQIRLHFFSRAGAREKPRPVIANQ